MALRINLYHEIQRARKEEQYDPLKISFMCLGLVGLCLAGWYFMRLRETVAVRDDHARQVAEIDRLKPLSAKAKTDEQQLKAKISLAESFSKRIEERFYWGPVLEQIASVIPPNIQVTKMSGDSNSGEIPRRISVSVEGVAAGDQPRKEAEDVRLALNEVLGQKYKGVAASFRSLDDSIEKVHFDGRDLSTAFFAITINFTVAGSAQPAPAPPVTKAATATTAQR